MENARDDSLERRLADRSVAERASTYAAEIRRLLDAGLAVMERCGTDTRPRVADIVAEAGLSNDAFYRHFRSKDELVAAILDDGTERLRSYLDHELAKLDEPADQARRWIECVLAQAVDPGVAATTLAVLWNANALSDNTPLATGPLAEPLRDAFAGMGSSTPELDSALAAHATIGKLSDWLWGRRAPTPAEIARVVEFCLAAAPGR